MATLTLYGSSVADATITTACDMANTAGGTETSKTTTTTGTSVYAEVLSQGGTSASVSSIPTTPTGNGWVYKPGAGVFATGNWSAIDTVSSASWSGSSSTTDITRRFFRYANGVYILIGTLNIAITGTAKTTYTYTATSMASIAFGPNDFIYSDLWWHDTNTDAGGDNPVIYESNSSSTGVANDVQITTSNFTAASAGGYFFGSFNLNDNANYYLRGKDLDFAEAKPTLQKLAHLDGEKQTGSVVNSRQIQVVLEVIGSSRTDLENRLDTLDLTLRLKQQQLILHAADNRYYTADCLSAKTKLVGESVVSAMVPLVFLCQIPYTYKPVPTTQTVAAATLSNVSGHIFKYADQSFAGGGTAVALPTIHLVNTTTIAWTQVQVFQNTDSRTLTITSNLPATTNDYMDIYCDPNNIPSGGFSVQKNGTTACAFNGVFPVLQPTTTSWTIQVTVASGTPQGSALWTWNARYMR